MAEKLKIIALGGLNEIGKNMTVLEYGKDMIVVDCGLGFPEDDMYGVDVVIPDRTCLKAAIERLASIGYVHEGNLGIEGREAFCYTGKPHLQLHHLYVCPANSEELRRHITFREFLRQNPDAVKQYSSVKEQAAQRFPDDIERYLEYKSPCIAELYRMCGLED